MWAREGCARPSSHQAVSVSSKWTRSAAAASSRTRARNSGRAISPRGRRSRSSLPLRSAGGGATAITSTGRFGAGSPGAAKCCLAASACTSTPCSRSPRSSPIAVPPGAPRYPAFLRLLPLPVAGEPALLVDLAQRRAARYGIRHGIVHPERWRALRNRAASWLAGLGLLPAPPGSIAVASAGGAPEAVRAARDVGGVAAAEWLLLVSSGSIVRRDAFLLFQPGDSTPAHVVKFSPVPGAAEQFERDEQAARLVTQTGGAVARRAPSLLARFEVGGRAA